MSPRGPPRIADTFHSGARAIAISRLLTPDERRYATMMFGVSIDYARVRIHARRAYPFQPAKTAMAPNGHIYFPPAVYRPDFSIEIGLAAWLVHELVHVWQHQHGMWVRVLGALCRRYDYGDLAIAPKPFRSFQIEQQASIVEDWFRISHGLAPRRGTGSPDDYRRIIPFLPPAPR